MLGREVAALADEAEGRTLGFFAANFGGIAQIRDIAPFLTRILTKPVVQ